MSAANPRDPLRKAGDADVHPSLPATGRLEPSSLRAGANTADAVLTADADKPVTLTVTVPKSLRKAVRTEAKRRGISVDDVVAQALRERTVR